MDDSRSLSERMAAVARELQDVRSDVSATFQHAVDLAEFNIDGSDGAAISFVRARRHVDTVAATNEMVVAADRLQYEMGEGPCLDAIWERSMIHSVSLGDDTRWPSWGPRVVAETEVQSILAFRLFTNDDTLGALNVYSRTRDAFDDEARDEGVALAAHIAIAVAASQEIEQLTTGMDSRTVIGQATGILMERFDLDAGRAFAVLGRLSSHENVKVRHVAAQVVAGRDVGRR